MNWIVSHTSIINLILIQKCCFPSRKEEIIKEKEFIDEDTFNQKPNSDNDSKYNKLI